MVKLIYCCPHCDSENIKMQTNPIVIDDKKEDVKTIYMSLDDIGSVFYSYPTGCEIKHKATCLNCGYEKEFRQ